LNPDAMTKTKYTHY